MVNLTIPAPVPGERPYIGWRLIALVYDFFPMLGLWFITVLIFMGLHRLAGSSEPAILPGTGWSYALFVALYLVTGIYAVASWRRGGQTIGMKPFRTYVLAPDGSFASTRSLWIRFFVGTVALIGGFWVGWIRKDRLTLHDLVSNTRLVRRSS